METTTEEEEIDVPMSSMVLCSSLSISVLPSGMVPHKASDRSVRAISPSKGFHKKRGAKGATLGQALSISVVAYNARSNGRVSQRGKDSGSLEVQRKSPY